VVDKQKPRWEQTTQNPAKRKAQMFPSLFPHCGLGGGWGGGIRKIRRQNFMDVEMHTTSF
jgi:hypothetical protein